MDYPEALTAMMNGKKVTAEHFNGKARGFEMHCAAQFPDAGSVNTQPYLYMVINEMRVPWSPSNLDQFAKDWSIVE